jgi:peptidoglycan/xylan/chitin deacetylase (PgdA/CDA1 family)
VKKIPILLYHSVSQHASKKFRPWAIHPHLFASHIEFLSERGYTPLSVTQLARIIRSQSQKIPERPVVITFDDGYADFLLNVLPILKRFQFLATLYVSTGYVNGTSKWLSPLDEGHRRMLTWGEIELIASEGIEFGTHSHNHLQLDLVPFAQAEDEIMTCKETFKKNLGLSVKSFSFPHGYHSKALLELLRQSDYCSACIVGHSMASSSSDLYALPRIIIHDDVSIEKLDAYLRGDGLRSDTLVNSISTNLWRWLRRGNEIIRTTFHSSEMPADATRGD